MSERLAIGAVALLAAAAAIKKGSRSIDPSLSSWMDGFFRRHPKLSKYRRQIRFRKRDSGGSAGHGEAQQHGDEVWVFPKFWGHPQGVQDFVMAHEIGHWVKSTHAFGSDFMDAARSVGVDPWDTPNLPFGQLNMEEAFADSFASYYTDGDVKRRYPAWTELVEMVQSRRGSSNALTFQEGKTPLPDYDSAETPNRFALCDPSVTTPSVYSTGRPQQYFEGLDPCVVGFVDWLPYGEERKNQSVYIFYMNVRHDMMKRGYGKKLIDEFYRRYAHLITPPPAERDPNVFSLVARQGEMNWGKIMHEGAWKMFQRMKARHPEIYHRGKNRT